MAGDNKMIDRKYNIIGSDDPLSSAAEIRFTCRCSNPGCICHRRDGNVHCPVPHHRDTHPSFSVREKAGKVLFHCHAGCSQREVILALEEAGIRIRRRAKKQGGGSR